MSLYQHIPIILKNQRYLKGRCRQIALQYPSAIINGKPKRKKRLEILDGALAMAAIECVAYSHGRMSTGIICYIGTASEWRMSIKTPFITLGFLWANYKINGIKLTGDVELKRRRELHRHNSSKNCPLPPRVDFWTGDEMKKD